MEISHDPVRKLLLWSTPVVLGHFFIVLWHLMLLAKVEPSTPGFLPPLLILINLIPVAGLVMLAKGFPKAAGIAVIVPLATGLAVGINAHFLTRGPDNVLHLPPSPLRLSFQISAALLVILEAGGCWLGLWMFKRGVAHPRAGFTA